MVDQTPTRNTILNYLALHPRSGCAVRRAAARTLFWGLSDGQLCPQSRKLEFDRLIAPIGVGEDARGKQVRRIFDAGHHVLRLWLRAPSQPVATRDENMIRSMLSARADKTAASMPITERRRHFTAFRGHLASLSPGETCSEEERRSAAGISDLRRNCAVEYCDLNLGWCDRFEAALVVEEKQ